MLKPFDQRELDIDYKNYKPGPFKAKPAADSDGIWIFVLILIVLILLLLPIFR